MILILFYDGHIISCQLVKEKYIYDHQTVNHIIQIFSLQTDIRNNSKSYSSFIIKPIFGNNWKYYISFKAYLMKM